MSGTNVEISELATRVQEIIDLASEGSEVILTDKQVPIAKLVDDHTKIEALCSVHHWLLIYFLLNAD